MQELQTLDLSHCQITEIDTASFSALTNLHWLKLDGNLLGGLQVPRYLTISILSTISTVYKISTISILTAAPPRPAARAARGEPPQQQVGLRLFAGPLPELPGQQVRAVRGE